MKKRPMDHRRPLLLCNAFFSLLSVFSIALTSCSKETKKKLTPEELRESMIAYANDYYGSRGWGQDVTILDDYGIYGDVYVARLFGINSFQEITRDTIADIVIVNSDYVGITAYDGERLYSIKEAYRDLKLVRKDLEEIRDKLFEKYPGFVQYVRTTEREGPAIVLEEKEFWTGTIPDGYSGNSLEVTVDWNFNAHRFEPKDFRYDAIESLSCLTPEYWSRYAEGYPEGVNHRYRLSLKQSGKTAVLRAIDALQFLDHVKTVSPVLR